MQSKYQFQDLSDQTILERFKKQDRWLLEEIVLLTFGYEYEGVNWDVTSDNAYPARQYHAALEATNNIMASDFLKVRAKKIIRHPTIHGVTYEKAHSSSGQRSDGEMKNQEYARPTIFGASIKRLRVL